MERIREENAALLAERKREAEAAVRLMRNAAEKNMQKEETKDGMDAGLRRVTRSGAHAVVATDGH
jgi:hypothetical protein